VKKLGSSLLHVGKQFEAFLECGILAHGFLRLRGGECAHEKLGGDNVWKKG